MLRRKDRQIMYTVIRFIDTETYKPFAGITDPYPSLPVFKKISVTAFINGVERRRCFNDFVLLRDEVDTFREYIDNTNSVLCKHHRRSLRKSLSFPVCKRFESAIVSIYQTRVVTYENFVIHAIDGQVANVIGGSGHKL